MEQTDQKPLSEEERKGLYDSEKRRAGRAATETDRATYARHLVEVMSHYRGQPNGFQRCVAEIERRCAKTHGFPELPEWLAANFPVDNTCL